jgi:hypothetical protein
MALIGSAVFDANRLRRREINPIHPILPISPHIFGFGNRWNSHGISEG